MNKYQKLFTKIIKSGSVWKYFLRDEFSDTVAAGAVNGTVSDSGATRVITDAGSKYSVGGGNGIASGGSGSYGDPAGYYDLAVSRAPGVVLSKKIAITSWAASVFPLAFSRINSANFSGFANVAHGFISSGSALMACGNVGAGPVVTPALTNGASYRFFLILRSSGAQYLVDDGAGGFPLLRFIRSDDNTATLRAAWCNNNAAFSHDFIHCAGYYLASPLVSHGFNFSATLSDGNGHAETSGLGSGGSGVAMSGTTWSVSGGKGINTPVLGSQLLLNTEFATDAANWSAINSATISRLDFSSSPNIAPTGGADNFGLSVQSTGNSNAAAQQNPTMIVGRWYQASCRCYSPSANIAINVGLLVANNLTSTSVAVTSENTWMSLALTGRATSTSGDVRLRSNSSNSGDVVYFDAISFREELLSDLLSLHSSSTPDVFAGIDITVVSGTQAGLALNWDSSSSPTSGVVAYHDGTNAKLEKCVNGTWTTIISNAATYSAGARLIVSKIGNEYRLYYNALVGSATISDSQIVNNKLHGIFSTYEGNTVDNYTCYASGTSGEYNILGSI